MRLWLDAQLAEIFGVTVRPSAETADRSTTRSRAVSLRRSSSRGHLYDRFNIEVLATTDDPCDDLAAHQFLRDDETWHGRVIPTFRPDKYLEPASADLERRCRPAGGGVGDRHR